MDESRRRYCQGCWAVRRRAIEQSARQRIALKKRHKFTLEEYLQVAEELRKEKEEEDESRPDKQDVE